MDYIRTALLVKAAKLYYEGELSQNEIAEQLSISRSYVSKLLAEAKENGIVNITIQDPIKAENDMERTIREHYNLRKAIVVHSQIEENTGDAVAREAARWLSSVVVSQDIVGIGWGRTMYLLAKRLPMRVDISGVKVVSLYGMQSSLNQNVFNTEGLALTAQALNAVCCVLPSPVFINNPDARRLFREEPCVKNAMDIARRANIAVFTVGAIKRTSFLQEPGFLTETEYRELLAKGATGDVCLHIINRHGKICDPSLDERVIGISLQELRQKDYRVAVASGRFKIDAVYAALEEGIINVLAIDEDIAKEIIERLMNKR